MRMTRAKLVLLALLGAALLFAQVLQGRLGGPQPLTFEGIEDLPGWRQIAFEDITAAGGTATGAVFAGIGEESAERLPAGALCSHLYPTASPKISAAVFTDVNCPNCASLDLKLNQRLDRLEINRIELPLLGASSEVYAKAIIAAGLMGEASLVQLIKEHQRGPRLAAGLLVEISNSGHDANRFKALAEGPDVARVLKRNRDAANTLGVWGTPALTIGSTLIMGDIEGETLDRLIELETARNSGGC